MLVSTIATSILQYSYYRTTIQPAKKNPAPFSNNLCRPHTHCRHDNELISLVLDWMQVPYQYQRIIIDWIVLCQTAPSPLTIFDPYNTRTVRANPTNATCTTSLRYWKIILYMYHIPYPPKFNYDQLTATHLPTTAII